MGCRGVGGKEPRVKLNFWQWLAVALLVIGGAWWAYDAMNKKGGAPAAPGTPPTTQTQAQ